MTPMTSGSVADARRCRNWLLALALCGGALLPGCGPAVREVAVVQPIEFNHRVHLEYFSSGKHRKENIAMHLVKFGDPEVPEELAQGRCTECHGAVELARFRSCGGCHTRFARDETLRGRKDMRACVGCHRNAWSGSSATIPSINVCQSCHSGEPRTKSPGERVLAEHLAKGQDIAWIQIQTMPPSVYFSHSAHVRRTGMTCTDCHEDMTRRSSPPTRYRVFSMNTCMTCHDAKGAKQDCLACHK